MAWWYARFLFEGDRLIDVGLDDAVTPIAEVTTTPARAAPGEELTSVLVSGYALYGRLRGYYALGVGRFHFDAQSGRALATDEAIRHVESVHVLSPAQADSVRRWLQRHSPEAWSSSLTSFRLGLGEPKDAAVQVQAALPSDAALPADAVPAEAAVAASPAAPAQAALPAEAGP